MMIFVEIRNQVNLGCGCTNVDVSANYPNLDMG